MFKKCEEMIMSKMFESLKKGLEEAIAIEKGELEGRKKTYIITPVKKYTNKQVKKIRNDANMTQKVFANYMGVSPKTVEAWENGINHPVGPACRLLSLLERKKEEAVKLMIG